MEEPKITDWISVGIALFAAGVSIWAIIANKKNTKIAEEAKTASWVSALSSISSASTAEKMFNEAYKPEIQIRLARDHGGMSSKGTIYLYVDNVGSMPCKDIKITITPKLNIIFNENQTPFEEKYNQFKLIGNSHTLNYDYINSKSTVRECLERCVFVNPINETEEYYFKTNHTFEIEYKRLSESLENTQPIKSNFTSSLNALLNMNPF